MRKLCAAALIAVLMVNMVLLALGRISWVVFWLVLIAAYLISRLVAPR